MPTRTGGTTTKTAQSKQKEGKEKDRGTQVGKKWQRITTYR